LAAELVACDEGIVIRKKCDEHGEFQTNVWRGSVQSWEEWNSLNYWGTNNSSNSQENKLCSLDCGLCADHLTPACFVIVEVTERCNLKCPVCFANAGGNHGADPSLEDLASVFENALKSEGVTPSLQLSGGEPTMREDLPAIIGIARSSGFEHIVLDTNGIKLGRGREYLRKLVKAGLDTLYLQFDGISEEPYVKLRGKPLLEDKHRAIDNCKVEGVGVILVPTVAKGANFEQVGDIVRFAMENMPTVRGIMFQPISMFGRYPEECRDSARITMPEFLEAVQKQTGDMVKVEDFVPTSLGRGCESHCGFFCFAFKSGDGLLPITRFPTQKQIKDILSKRGNFDDEGLLGLEYWKEYWKPPEPSSRKECCCTPETMAGPDCLTISGMLFQDAWNLDVERLRKCCIHVATLDGSLVPFCAYNITAENGTALYRERKLRIKTHA
jgi:hypothetical protein